MSRPRFTLWIGVFALILSVSTLAQPSLHTAGAHSETSPSDEVHHFGDPPETWESMLTGDTERDLNVIVGRDDRVQISPTNQRPYQSIAYLEAWDEDQGLAISCTATFVGPRTLLTAAHCLWEDEFGGWPDGVVVAPGKDGQANPFGYEFAQSIWVPNGWKEGTGNSQSRFRHDYGLVTLRSSTLGETVGALEIGVLGDVTLQSADFHPTTSGYPGDKEWGTQWTSTEPSFDSVTGTHLRNSIDAFQGQSGSAIWGANDGRITGIISYETRTTNYALRINQTVIDGLLRGCAQINCDFDYSYEGDEPAPEPTEPPAPTPTPEPEPTLPPDPTPDPPVGPTPVGVDAAEFGTTWARTDRPVADGVTNRTWMWGPEPFTDAIIEPYTEAPDGQRTVKYYDKSRMEITNPDGDRSSIWYVTNGLLVNELITGELQTGEGSFERHNPAQVNVAGDAGDQNSPTYASFAGLLDAPALADGEVVTQRIDRAGRITSDPTLAEFGVTSAHYVPETGHSIASVFWQFMHTEGTVYEHGGFTSGPLFANPFYATGLPVSEPYWTTVLVNGTPQNVLVQAFQRRVLTYTPSNPEGWQVEAGNVGQHYYQWRYEQVPEE